MKVLLFCCHWWRLVDLGPPAESDITVEFLAQNLEFITIGLWRNLLVSGYS